MRTQIEVKQSAFIYYGKLGYIHSKLNYARRSRTVPSFVYYAHMHACRMYGYTQKHRNVRTVVYLQNGA